MSQETCYGVICDIHGAKDMVPKAAKILKNKGADCLVLNGDLADTLPTMEENKAAIAYVVEEAAKTGLDVYVQPGGHESFKAYFSALRKVSEEYSNVHDCLKPENQKIDRGSHQIVFLPGSDVQFGGEFRIICDEGISSGLYALNMQDSYLSNMNDLKTLVDKPEATLVFCHIPPRFENLKEGIDLIEFGRVIKDFNLNEIKLTEGQAEDLIIPKGKLIRIGIATKLYNQGLPVELIRENRGNKDLRKTYKELGIKKAVSGHFHGAGQRANDWSGKVIPQNIYSKSLFYNPGALAKGYTGLFIIKGEEACYENLKINHNSNSTAQKISSILKR